MNNRFRKWILIGSAFLLALELVLVVMVRKVPTNNKVVFNPEPTPGGAAVSTVPLTRFVVMSDSQGLDNGVNTPVVKKALENIKKLELQPGFFVMPGDIVNGASTYDETKKQLEYLKTILTSYYPAEDFYRGIGNHEMEAGVAGERASEEVFKENNVTYMNAYNNSIYYFDKNGSRFWMLNTEHTGFYGTIPDDIIAWIRQNNNPNSKFNFFFYHSPAFPTGATGFFGNFYQRDKLWQAIEETNTPIVFNGHEHYYTRRHINSDYNETINGTTFNFTKNVYQVTAGGMPDHLYTDYSEKKDVDVAPISVNHYVVVDVYSDRFEVTAYNMDAAVIDKFEVK